MLKGEGRDTGGKGNADALITAQLEAVSAHVTKCVVSTDLHISGKVAQFGRGVMGDVSGKLMAQFAQNLNTMLDQEQDDPQEAAALVEEAVAHAQDVVAHLTDAAPVPTADAPTAEPAVRKIQGPAAEPIQLSEFAGSAVLKRLLPALGGLALLLLILRRLRK